MSSSIPSRRSAVQRLNIAFIAIIFIFGIVLSLLRDADRIKLDFEDSQMTITGPDGAPFAVTAAYQDILSVSESDALDPGVLLEGLDTEHCRFGSWRNDAYGEYTLCDSPAFPEHIVLETADGIVVFNYEDADSTHSLYSALMELLRDYGQEP